MFLADPKPTEWDFSFSLFGFPVRVNPLFFIFPLLFASGLTPFGMNPGVGFLLVSLLYFGSILIHEMGHALAFRRYGFHARIVLYAMGGLAIPEQFGWGSQRGRMNAYQRMFVSFAGPLAGFILAFVLVILGMALGGKLTWAYGIIPFPQISLEESLFPGNLPIHLVINGGILINIFLNLLNLVPVYPLDGGQIAREFLVLQDPRDGLRNSLYLSIAVCGLLVVFGLMGGGLRFMAIFFAFMGFSNFQMLQMQGRSRW